MHERQLTAASSSWSAAEHDATPASRAAVHSGWPAWLGSDTVAVFDAFLLLGLLGVYLKLALLAPQWGAVARFLGKEPGQPLGWLDRLGFFANDLLLNLVIVPVAATLLVSLACGAWRVAAACGAVAVLSLAYFVELRASTEVGQYISGQMLRDFVGWSAAHPSSASDYLTPASVIKLTALLLVII